MPNVKKEDNCITVVRVRKINSIMWNLFLKPNNFMLCCCWNLSQGLYLMSVSNNLCMWWVCLSLLWACLRCPRQRSWNYFVSTQIHNANTNTQCKHKDKYTNDKCLSLDQLELFRLHLSQNTTTDGQTNPSRKQTIAKYLLAFKTLVENWKYQVLNIPCVCGDDSVWQEEHCEASAQAKWPSLPSHRLNAHLNSGFDFERKIWEKKQWK